MNSCFLVPLEDKEQTIYIAEPSFPTPPSNDYDRFNVPATPGEQGNKESTIELCPEGDEE